MLFIDYFKDLWNTSTVPLKVVLLICTASSVSLLYYVVMLLAVLIPWLTWPALFKVLQVLGVIIGFMFLPVIMMGYYEWKRTKGYPTKPATNYGPG